MAYTCTCIHTHNTHAHKVTPCRTEFGGPQNKDQMMSYMSHQWGRSWESNCLWTFECVCMCVCTLVCERGREREREQQRKRRESEISSTPLMYSRHSLPVARLLLSTEQWEESFSPLPHTNSGCSIYEGPRLCMGPFHVHLHPDSDLQCGCRGLRIHFFSLLSLSLSSFLNLSFSLI